MAYLYQQSQQPQLIVRTPTPVITDHRLDAMRYFRKNSSTHYRLINLNVLQETDMEPDKSTQRKKKEKVVLSKNTTHISRPGHKLPDINDLSFLGGAIKTKSLLPSIRPLK